MRKHQEIAVPNSCLNIAKENEWVFVLLGRDPAAPLAIRTWIAERIRIGKNTVGDTQMIDAENIASKMEQEIIIK